MKYAMIEYARWHDGLRFPLTIVREERRFMDCVPPVAPFERTEIWTVCARDRQEAERTVQYHFGRTLIRYELGAGQHTPRAVPPLVSPNTGDTNNE